MGEKNTLKKLKEETRARFTLPPTPLFFGYAHADNFVRRFSAFLRNTKITNVVDQYEEQLSELYYLKNPSIVEDSPEGKKGEHEFITRHRGKFPDSSYCGTWVYYPWTSTLVHFLSPELHQVVRTARNQYLVTNREQYRLEHTVIGIAGLSIGNSVALTLAYSGIANTLKLADPDVLCLSNLNRTRAPAHFIGVKKVYIAAQQIYELNPYAQIKCYPEGVTRDTIEDFLTGAPKPSLVVDEMDDIKLKIFLRLAARTTRIPLVMATDNGDNAIVDIERYDENPFIKPFDSLPQLSLSDVAQGISYGEPLELAIKEKVVLATKLVGAHNAVYRMQKSLLRVGDDLRSWPQLGIAAFLGGAALAFVIKKIVLGMKVKSGKTHVSLDSLFETESPSLITDELSSHINNPALVTHENSDVWRTRERDFPKRGTMKDQLLFILRYATMAPSTHNTQPWRFRIENEDIILFGDHTRALPVSDPTKRNYYISLGACLYNIRVALRHFGFGTTVSYFPDDNMHMIAKIICVKTGRRAPREADIFPAIVNRFTDKLDYLHKKLPESLIDAIAHVSKDSDIHIRVITDKAMKRRIGDWVADSTRHIMKKQTFRTELASWMRHNYTKSFDGMPAHTVGVSDIQSIAGPFLMKTINLATGNSDRRHVQESPALVVMTVKKESQESWVRLGEAYEHILLLATQKHVHNATLTALVESPIASRLTRLYLKLPGRPQVFFRLGYSNHPILRSPRIPVTSLLQ